MRPLPSSECRVLTSVIVLAGLMVNAPPATAQSDATRAGAGPADASTPTDSTGWFRRLTHHGVAGSHADDLDVVSVFSTVSTDPTRARAFRLDLAYPFVEPFRLDHGDRIEIAADPLVFLVTALPIVTLAMLCPACDPAMQVTMAVVAPIWIPVLRPTGVWQPVRWAGLGVGYDSEYVFLADDKGVTFRPFAGLQLDLGKYARLEAGIQQNWLWNWKRASRDLGAGWFVRVGLGTEWIGGGEIPEPTEP